MEIETLPFDVSKVFRNLNLRELEESTKQLLIHITAYRFFNSDSVLEAAIIKHFNEDIVGLIKFKEEREKKEEERSDWFSLEKIKILKIYNLLQKELKEEMFSKIAMPAKYRFNPAWYQDCVNFFVKEIVYFIGDFLYTIYDVAGDRCVYGDTEYRRMQLDSSVLSEEDKKIFLMDIKKIVAENSMKQNRSLCNTFYFNEEKPLILIFLNPFSNPVVTLLSMWHEFTHYLQRREEKTTKWRNLIYKQEQVIARTNTEDSVLDKKEIKRVNFDNEHKKFKLLLETQACLNASMIVFLEAIKYGINNEQLEKLKNILIKNTDVSYSNNYIAFSLVKKFLEKLKEKKSFVNKFLEDGKINLVSLYEYTYKKSLEQIKEILHFAEQHGLGLKDLEKNESLMRDSNNPIYKMVIAKNQYLQDNPSTEIELVEDLVYSSAVKKDENDYITLLKKIHALKQKEETSKQNTYSHQHTLLSMACADLSE